MFPGKYQTLGEKPIAVEAVQFREYETIEDLLVWLGALSNIHTIDETDAVAITIPSPDNTENQTAVLGDWFVKEDGGVYVVKPEAFTQIYVPFGFDASTVSSTIDLAMPIVNVKKDI